MQTRRTQKDVTNRNQVVSKARRDLDQREKGYREQALKIYPWVCARCGREYSGKKLQMLTVHHKDHNHDNNPRDGSNWELLCLYCHDNEHSRFLDADKHHEILPGNDESSTSTYRPFSGLENLLKDKK